MPGCIGHLVAIATFLLNGVDLTAALLGGCQEALVISDTNRDQRLDRYPEYLLYLNHLSQPNHQVPLGRYTSFDALPTSWKSNFQAFATADGYINITTPQVDEFCLQTKASLASAADSRPLLRGTYNHHHVQPQATTVNGQATISDSPQLESSSRQDDDDDMGWNSDGLITEKLVASPAPAMEPASERFLQSSGCDVFVKFADLDDSKSLNEREYLVLANLLADETLAQTFDDLTPSLKTTFGDLGNGQNEIWLEDDDDDDKDGRNLKNVFQHGPRKVSFSSTICSNMRADIAIDRASAKAQAAPASRAGDKQRQCTSQYAPMFDANQDGSFSADEYATFVKAVAREPSEGSFLDLPDPVQNVFFAQVAREQNPLAMLLNSGDATAPHKLLVSFEGVCGSTRQIANLMRASSVSTEHQAPPQDNNNNPASTDMQLPASIDSLFQNETVVGVPPPQNANFTTTTCTENPQDYNVNIDVQITFLDNLFAACDSQEQDDAINTNIQEALNQNFATTVTDWDGTATFGTFVFDLEQEVNNVEFGTDDFFTDDATARFRHLADWPVQRTLQTGTCPSRAAVECTAPDYCRWGCVTAVTTNCGNPPSTTNSWSALAEDVRARLSTLGFDCLGLPDQLQVVLSVDAPTVDNSTQATTNPTQANTTTTTMTSAPANVTTSPPQANATSPPQANATSSPQANATNAPEANTTSVPEGNTTAIANQGNATASPQANATSSVQGNATGAAQANTTSTSPAQSNATSVPTSNATNIPQSNATSPSQTNATNTPQGNATSPPGTNVTSPPQTNATSPPASNATSPPVSNATLPPQANVTSPPQANVTSPPLSNSTNMTTPMPTFAPSNNMTQPNGTLAPTNSPAPAPLPNQTVAPGTMPPNSTAPVATPVPATPAPANTSAPTPAPAPINTTAPTPVPTVAPAPTPVPGPSETVTVYNSWIMSNAVGQTAAGLMADTVAFDGIKAGYASFTDNIVAEMAALRVARRRLRGRRLAVAKESGSSNVDSVVDSNCPEGIGANINCVTAFGSANLVVTDENVDVVAAEYEDTSQLGIDSGQLQQDLFAADPGSLWLVEGSSTPTNPADGVPDPPTDAPASDGISNLALGLIISGSIAVFLVAVVCLLVILPACRKKRDLKKARKDALEAYREAEARHKAALLKKQQKEDKEEEDKDDKGPTGPPWPGTDHHEGDNPYREQVEQLILENCPDKMDEIDSLLHQYQGREEELIAMLEDFREDESILAQLSDVDASSVSSSSFESESESVVSSVPVAEIEVEEPPDELARNIADDEGEAVEEEEVEENDEEENDEESEVDISDEVIEEDIDESEGDIEELKKEGVDEPVEMESESISTASSRPIYIIPRSAHGLEPPDDSFRLEPTETTQRKALEPPEELWDKQLEPQDDEDEESATEDDLEEQRKRISAAAAAAAAAAATKQAEDEARRQSKQVEKDWSDQASRLQDEQELAETDEGRRNAEAEAKEESASIERDWNDQLSRMTEEQEDAEAKEESESITRDWSDQASRMAEEQEEAEAAARKLAEEIEAEEEARRIAAEEAERLAEEERLEAARREEERRLDAESRERAEQERLEAEAKLEAERLEQARLEAEMQARAAEEARLEAERLKKEEEETSHETFSSSESSSDDDGYRVQWTQRNGCWHAERIWSIEDFSESTEYISSDSSEDGEAYYEAGMETEERELPWKWVKNGKSWAKEPVVEARVQDNLQEEDEESYYSSSESSDEDAPAIKWKNVGGHWQQVPLEDEHSLGYSDDSRDWD